MSHDWRCPFPPEADTAQVDEALVTLDITVRPDGTPAAVRIVSDPGNGFGRMAYQCAMRQRFVTALDPDGNSIQGVVRAPVHFNR
jgi:protein TonB